MKRKNLTDKDREYLQRSGERAIEVIKKDKRLTGEMEDNPQCICNSGLHNGGDDYDCACECHKGDEEE